MHIYRSLATIFTVMLLSACGTTQVNFQYVAPSSVIPAAESATLEIGTFVDQRGEPFNYLGAIRGGFGNPLKVIETAEPISTIVETTFGKALAARKFQLSGSDSKFRIAGTIKKLFCNQLMQREAEVEIELNVVDRRTQAIVFAQSYASTNYEASRMSSGVLASPEDLRLLTERTLREVIDKALDDSAFRQAVRSQ